MSDPLHRDDTATLRRPAGSGVNFKDLIGGAAEETESQLPDPTAPYEAYGRAANKPLYTLHCCLGADGYRSFQYVHLDSWSHFESSAEGQTIRLRFGGTRLVDVTIAGRNLRLLYDYIHQHRMPWIRLCDNSFTDGAKPIITRLRIDAVEAVGLSPEEG